MARRIMGGDLRNHVLLQRLGDLLHSSHEPERDHQPPADSRIQYWLNFPNPATGD